jgi:two-component system phosphate regulon sensor histidine kinase PhoR
LRGPVTAPLIVATGWGNWKPMKRAPWFLHPISIFVFSTLALGLSLFLYIHWYMAANANLKTLVQRFDLNPDQLMAPQTWIVIMVLSILVGIILMGIFTIFVYQQKTLQLFTLQHTFINNFTHELKTPVTSLKIFLETFLKHPLSAEDQARYVQYMLSDVTRLSSTINRILSLAHLESKSYRAAFEPHDVVSVIAACIAENAIIFKDSRIRIVEQPSRPLIIHIDRPLLEMLVINLVTNAIRYNDAETPSVDISVSLRGRTVHIEFKDNGIGLDPRETRKIFRKFYQARITSGTVKTRGSGLGLHLVQNIAKLHRGRVMANSEGPGRGTVFTVVLPLKQRLRSGADQHESEQ